MSNLIEIFDYKSFTYLKGPINFNCLIAKLIANGDIIGHMDFNVKMAIIWHKKVILQFNNACDVDFVMATCIGQHFQIKKSNK